MNEFKIVITDKFTISFREVQNFWKEIELDDSKIRKYSKMVETGINSLKQWPERYADVSATFGFPIPTRRILIGNQYAIFYRIENQFIIIGPIASSRQMKIAF
ncbi:MAG: type II toxin-antitoxin system RelE/ParE family toxin [Lactobacillaceae bacterium]|nr:type II toxin-antitoxin system RelE/ParE family toxin [Lactobacillaceae bacterium]